MPSVLSESRMVADYIDCTATPDCNVAMLIAIFPVRRAHHIACVLSENLLRDFLSKTPGFRRINHAVDLSSGHRRCGEQGRTRMIFQHAQQYEKSGV
jgi:hypothetical protein